MKEREAIILTYADPSGASKPIKVPMALPNAITLPEGVTLAFVDHEGNGCTITDAASIILTDREVNLV
jgi:hypothetical protein